jgi:uncharacterized membrane protein YphA (DoxX/SURF4 family)
MTHQAIVVGDMLELPIEWLLALRLVLGLTFIVAGLSKLAARDDLARTVISYGILPSGWAQFVATWLPRFELMTGMLLVLGVVGRAAAALAALALAAFTAGAIVNLLRGRVIDCGCFGPTRIKRVTWRTVARNVLLVAAAVVLVLDPAYVFSIESLWMDLDAPGLPAGDAAAIAVTAAGTLATLLLLADAIDLTRLLRQTTRELSS